jgi:hypothetical protein
VQISAGEPVAFAIPGLLYSDEPAARRSTKIPIARPCHIDDASFEATADWPEWITVGKATRRCGLAQGTVRLIIIVKICSVVVYQKSDVPNCDVDKLEIGGHRQLSHFAHREFDGSRMCERIHNDAMIPELEHSDAMVFPCALGSLMPVVGCKPHAISILVVDGVLFSPKCSL